FDLLAENDRALVDEPLEVRRKRLDAFMKRRGVTGTGIVLSPSSRNIADARKWLSGAGGALDGVVAKRLGIPYSSGNRHGMVKVKRRQTADCVVGGFRYGSKSRIAGSLLLGLYDKDGLLHHVGFPS